MRVNMTKLKKDTIYIAEAISFRKQPFPIYTLQLPT